MCIAGPSYSSEGSEDTQGESVTLTHVVRVLECWNGYVFNIGAEF